MKHWFSKVIFAVFLTTHMAAADDITVLAFGDSLTHGYGLPAQDGFVPQLQAWIVANGMDVALHNGGVSGDTTAGGAARINWSLSDDIDAVIVALGGNDALRGLPVAQTRANLDLILSEIAARNLPVLLVGIHAPTNFGTGYAQEFNAIYTDLAAVHNVPLYANFLQAIHDAGDRQTILRTLLQGDALHPNAAGVRLIVDHMGPSVLAMLDTAQ